MATREFETHFQGGKIPETPGSRRRTKETAEGDGEGSRQTSQENEVQQCYGPAGGGL